MTKDEALKLALEALQKIYIAPEHEEYIRVWWPACEQAITAIKEALAQPEPEYLAFMDTPQRTWVGLTDEEIEQMGLSNYIKVVRQTEAALKAKNT